jgi:hypothetical protein
MKERIRNLLIAGLKATEVATIVGCSPSYIAQLMKEEEFIQSVEAGKIAAQTEKTEEDHLDTRYQNLEHKIITSIEGSLDEASLGEKVRALETINKRSDAIARRKLPVPTGTTLTVNNNYVSLAMPQQAMKHMGPVVEVNTKQEVIAIDGKALAPMSSDGVKGLFERLKARNDEDKQMLAEM